MTRMVVAVDTETNGLDLLKSKPVGVSFAFENGYSEYFAFGHPEGNNATIDQVRERFEQCRQNNAIIVAHNAQFDANMLLNIGVEPYLYLWEDTIIIASMLAADEPAYSLDALAEKYTGVGKLHDNQLNDWCAQQFGGRPDTKNQVKNYHKAPGWMVAPYAKQDTIATLALYKARRPEIDKVYDNHGNSLAGIYDWERRLLPGLIRMYRNGVPTDIRYAEEAKSKLDEIVASEKESFNSTYTVQKWIKPKRSKKRTVNLAVEGSGIGFSLAIAEPPQEGHFITVPANPGSSIHMLELLTKLEIPFDETEKSRAPKFDKNDFPVCAAVEGVTCTHTSECAGRVDENGLPFYDKEKKTVCKYQQIGRVIPKTDNKFLKKLEHPLGKHIVRIRKIEKTSKDFLGAIIEKTDENGMIHPQFHQLKGEEYGTISGRFSSGGKDAVNIQQMQKPKNPKEGEEPGEFDWLTHFVRNCFTPISPDHEWMSIDMSQVEYRLFAHFAAVKLGFGGLILKEYVTDPHKDFHSLMADLTKLPRGDAKNVNFAKLYGAGPKKVALMCGVTVDEAIKIIKQYDEGAPEAKALLKFYSKEAEKRGFVTTILGRQQRFPYIARENGGVYQDKVYAALNTVLQGSGADLLKRAMVIIFENIVDYNTIVPFMTIHDELTFSKDRGAAGEKKMREIREVMQYAPEILTPLLSEISLGERWGSLQPWKG